MTAASLPKITYTSANVDLEQFHAMFDEALVRVRGASGKEYPMYIDGKAITTTAEQLVDTSPIDASRVLGTFHTARPEQIDLAVKAARALKTQWSEWSGLPAQDTLFQTMRNDPNIVNETLKYYDEFYKTINDQRQLKREIIEQCLGGSRK